MKKNKINKFFSSFFYELFRPILRILIIIFVNPKIINKKNIPKKKGCILAGTHTSYYDALIIGSATLRPLHFLAKKELMDTPVIGFILKLMGIVRIDRSKKNPEACDNVISMLNNDGLICIFPEGTICRDKTKDILPFKYGAVSFAYKTGKPIIPFAIVGNPKLFNYHVKIIFGKPFYVKDDNLEKANKELENIVINLIKEGKKNGKR